MLIFLNETNIVKPPIALTIDRVKSEFTALRRQNKPIHIGVCRCADRTAFNNATIQHLGSLSLREFESLSQNEPVAPMTVHSEPKKLLSLFSSKKKSATMGKRKSMPCKTSDTDGECSAIH